MKLLPCALFSCFMTLIFTVSLFAVTITIDAGAGKKPISPWIYGRNSNLSDAPAKPVTSKDWQMYRDAGLRMLRECGGNNATKYNWRKKLTSHPDWYNNVYAHDWDFLAKSLQDSLPEAQGLLAFQLLGKVAANTNNNFNDGAYNGSAYWSGVAQNLAGGGTVNTAGGGAALKNGDPALYLMDWPADSSAAILDHWFKPSEAGIDSTHFFYWNMDNEPEIWNGTHDDAVQSDMPVEDFLQKYFAVAKAARKRFPGIKLVGFVACNEWQWYAWNNKAITVTENGAQKSYVWAEYFIKRIGEEQKASGVRLLDVMDFHFYPGTASDAGASMQLHRIWFDTSWNCPIANGSKLIGGGWNEAGKKEYIMSRCAKWLDTYLGAGHGVTFGVTECGTMYSTDPNVVAVWYAAMLGTFADNGVTLFTPWEWNIGQWETLHLFSRYAHEIRVQSTSSVDTLLSAYSSVNTGTDSMTIIFVNRDRSASQTAAVSLSNFTCANGSFPTLQLSGLPSTETFTSHTSNALKTGTVTVSANSFSLTLPKTSVTAVLLAGAANGAARPFFPSLPGKNILIFTKGKVLYVHSAHLLDQATITLYTIHGAHIRSWTKNNTSDVSFSLEDLPAGSYMVVVNNGMVKRQVMVVR